MSVVQDVYQQTISDLRTDKDEMKKDNVELRTKFHDLQKKVDEHSKAIRTLQYFKCTVVDCKNRTKD